jgi:hypothetical protein
MTASLNKLQRGQWSDCLWFWRTEFGLRSDGGIFFLRHIETSSGTLPAPSPIGKGVKRPQQEPQCAHNLNLKSCEINLYVIGHRYFRPIMDHTVVIPSHTGQDRWKRELAKIPCRYNHCPVYWLVSFIVCNRTTVLLCTEGEWQFPPLYPPPVWAASTNVPPTPSQHPSSWLSRADTCEDRWKDCCVSHRATRETRIPR